ncbi:hypothetical protein ZHAS_00013734 [Anopheles sinensis]|uniref:Uncharacterized protein n=1 Tax=Anopheles sinensis TaxID=74873 RepID=A0A084W6B6_ANOSI|nr:hypothetical protein ZHAS_00013734 [Anopheles sinensis]
MAKLFHVTDRRHTAQGTAVHTHTAVTHHSADHPQHHDRTVALRTARSINGACEPYVSPAGRLQTPR